MDLKRKLAVAGVGILGVAGLGAGTAVAQSSHSSTKTEVPVIPDNAASKTVAPEPSAPETDNVQQGDQTTPDATGTAAEKPSGEEPGDANLPGGGHADAPGQNVDHQFEGVE